MGLGLRGRSGILSLVEECLALAPGEERPLTMLLGPRGSGASQAHGAVLDRFGSEQPFAYVNFGGDHSLLPRYALALVARQMAQKVRRYGRARFPLLTLGLLASDEDLRIHDQVDGRRAVRRQVDHFQEANEQRYDGDYLTAFLDVGAGALGLPDGVSSVALKLVTDAVRHGRKRLTGKLSSSAHWFGAHPMTSRTDDWDALLEINQWRHEGDAADHERLDRLLLSAFLEDLRRNCARSFMPRSYLLLLDNAHTPYGRRFLDLLLHARHEDTVMNNLPCDPLTAVASANRWLPRWGPASGDTWLWRPRGPDRASLADWREYRPSRDSEDTWWYPLRLRDLSLDEVRIRIDLRFGGVPELAPYTRLTPFVHRLTGGLPRAVQQVLDVLRQSGPPAHSGVEQDLWLRSLPERPLRVGDRTARLVDVALRHLLRGLAESEQEGLAECAAARDLSTGAQVLGHGDALFAEVRARWLLDPAGLDPVLHPWLRRLLLWRLAERPADWDGAHELLADHYRSQGRPVFELYHLLATGRVDEVADALTQRFRSQPATRWISDLEAVTAAPNRLPAGAGPLELIEALGSERGPAAAMDTATVVRGLVTARWLWSDPLADPGMRLSGLVADGYGHLAHLRRDDIVPLLNEAERYRYWQHPQNWGGTGMRA
ncbi:hypothetical protein [Streptomyces sp. DW26H14]|uniref:hypothetical protein n=1 Tax=Streptomyces sp. DW26H14 TaxID=3435395 RepID=UPI00403DF0FE